jgi:hypothetical protein
MRVTTVTCDRCLCVINDRVTALDVLNGQLPRLRDRVDLCESCSRAFSDWLTAEQKARQPERAAS